MSEEFKELVLKGKKAKN